MVGAIAAKLAGIKNRFRYENPLEKYKTQIEDAGRLIKMYDQKYGISSEDFIKKRYSHSHICLDVEAADANNWATLYITLGRYVR